MGATAGEAARGDPSLRTALQDWAYHEPVVDPTGAAALFRAPSQRVLSSFHFNWGLHLMGSGDYFCRNSDSGVDASDPLVRHCFQEWRAFIHSQKNRMSERDFAASPGVAGCAAKMLTGCGCATRPLKFPSSSSSPTSSYPLVKDQLPLDVACDRRSVRLDRNFAKLAAAKVDHLAFVGLTDLYDASVCLFHHSFPVPSEVGGSSAGEEGSGGPQPSEFTHFNVGAKRGGGKAYQLLGGVTGAPAMAPPKTTQHDESNLEDFVDVLDEEVFAAALSRFERDLDRALAAVREGE